ncbi:MAG: Double zinc ribbon [Candidatus Woesearchaeota archaeon]|nr:Double zinc ribbon [Candidatus Woesearchaeota archaeon]
MEWFKEKGFEDNPLGIDTVGTIYDMADRENETKELLDRILSKNIVVIEGGQGVGKTMLLMYVVDNFKGKGKVIYVNARNLNKKLDIEELLRKRYGFVKGRILGRMPKDMILLLDNVESISKKNCEKIRYYYDEDYLSSVVLTCTNYEKLDITDALRSRIGKRVIKLKPMPKDVFVEMVVERIEASPLLPREFIEKAYDIEPGNIKKALVILDKACEYAFNAGKEEVDDDEFKKAIANLPDVEEKEPLEVYHCPKCGRELKKVGNYYRCEYCDQYCEACGALCTDDDKFCPECGAIFEVDENES